MILMLRLYESTIMILIRCLALYKKLLSSFMARHAPHKKRPPSAGTRVWFGVEVACEFSRFG